MRQLHGQAAKLLIGTQFLKVLKGIWSFRNNPPTISPFTAAFPSPPSIPFPPSFPPLNSLHPPSSPSLLFPFSRFPPHPPPPQKQQVGLKNFLGPQKFFNPKKFLNHIFVAFLKESKGGPLPTN